jgi:hypothetical protein
MDWLILRFPQYPTCHREGTDDGYQNALRANDVYKEALQIRNVAFQDRTALIGDEKR